MGEFVAMKERDEADGEVRDKAGQRVQMGYNVVYVRGTGSWFR